MSLFNTFTVEALLIYTNYTICYITTIHTKQCNLVSYYIARRRFRCWCEHVRILMLYKTRNRWRMPPYYFLDGSERVNKFRSNFYNISIDTEYGYTIQQKIHISSKGSNRIVVISIDKRDKKFLSPRLSTMRFYV